MELTVMGAGIFGLCLAWEATQRGAKVTVIDPNGPGGGASGGLVGALAPHAPENWTEAKALQFTALRMAPSLWAGVQAASGRDPGFARSGRVQPLPDARAIARAEARAIEAETLWQGEAIWSLRAADRPGDPLSPTGLLAEDTLSARVNPRMALPALMAALRNHGAAFHTEATPIGDAVIWATGAAGLRDLSQSLGRDIGRGEKGQALSLQGGLPPGAPQIYAPGLHIVPHADGTVAIGSTSERDYDDPQTTDAQLDDLLARAVAVLPTLKDRPVLTRWAGERPRAISRSLILDRWPGREGHFVANGGFKTGFAMAPLAAKLMIDLILTGEDKIPETFRLP